MIKIEGNTTIFAISKLDIENFNKGMALLLDDTIDNHRYIFVPCEHDQVEDISIETIAKILKQSAH